MASLLSAEPGASCDAVASSDDAAAGASASCELGGAFGSLPLDYAHYDADTGADTDSCASEPPRGPGDGLGCQWEARALSLSDYDPERHFLGSQPLHEQLWAGLVIEGRYQIAARIGKGSFGAAFVARDLTKGLKEVVIKARVSTSGGGQLFSESLADELDVYERLGAARPQPGIPQIFSAGVHRLMPRRGGAGAGRGCVLVSYIAMQRLGDSVWAACHRRAERVACDEETGEPIKLSVHVPPSRELIARAAALAALHARGIIHRDVKTENFCLDRDDGGGVYALDLGFARAAFGHYCLTQYKAPRASFWGARRPHAAARRPLPARPRRARPTPACRAAPNYAGTPNYASIAALQQLPQTARDDLEALAYCLAEMEAPGCRLPWNSALTTASEAAAGWGSAKLFDMARLKAAAWQRACREGVVPDYVRTYQAYCTSLEPWDVPDYAWLQEVLESGTSGAPPSRAPRRRRYAGWPASGARFDLASVAASLLAQLREAASAVLPRAAPAPASPPVSPPTERRAPKRPLPQQAPAALATDSGSSVAAGEGAALSCDGAAAGGSCIMSSAGEREAGGESPELLPLWAQAKRRRAAPGLLL
ncbi:Casein kinase I [Scenedesmus sp. PABB004]|nr:Casein kinase I [Scenedesmus sp. PABB004]